MTRTRRWPSPTASWSFGPAAQQVGTPDEVYRDPATPFVASFVGPLPANLVP